MKPLARLCLALSLVLGLTLIACGGGGNTTPEPATPAAEASPVPSDLEGTLIYTQGISGVFAYTIQTGELTPLFTPGQNSFVGSAAVSPDASEIVMAYAPAPIEDGGASFGYTHIAVMPIEGTDSPEIVLEPGENELYTLPAWSPDGTTLYFGHVTPNGEAYGGQYGLFIERMTYPGGEPEVIIENAFWPRISPDGTKIAYVSVAGPVDSLVVANVDGSDPVEVVPSDRFAAIDAITWTPDSTEVMFSAVAYGAQPVLNWFDHLLGVQVASAHDVPSDLWKVSAEGGDPVQLTTIGDFGLYPTFSPDGDKIALLRGSGVYVMNPDGSELSRILGPGPTGTLDWIP